MIISIALETPRLQLRQWRTEDQAAFAALNADPQVMQHFPALLSRAQSDGLAQRLAEDIDEHGWGFWALEAPGVASFIGFVGIRPTSAGLPFAPAVEIGWRLARPFWGRGYAGEAAQAALRAGFELLALEEIVAFTVPANLRSQAVMARLGMRCGPEYFDHPALPEGHPMRRHILYRLSNSQWSAARPGLSGSVAQDSAKTA